MDHGLDGWSLIPVEAREFSLLHGVKAGSGVHPASSTMRTDRKVTRAPSSTEVRNSEAVHRSPTSLHGVALISLSTGTT